jgi:rubrerythrin
MADEIVRCSYCVHADGFMPMLQRPSWFICERCGHVVIPDDPDFKCSCVKCTEIKRAA